MDGIEVLQEEIKSYMMVDWARAHECVELEANYQSYGSPAIAHKRAKHSAHKPIDQINL